MILNRLYELALRENLLEDPSFESQPVPFVIQVGEGGTFLGIDGERPRPPRRGEERVERRYPIPRQHGNAASQGFARYFVDTLPRVLPIVTEEKAAEKEARSRASFWRQIDGVADDTNEPALRAVQAFGKRFGDPAFVEIIRKAVADKDATGAERVTFAYYPDCGQVVVENPKIRTWYREFFRRFTATKQLDGPVGFCTITGTVGPQPTSHAIKLTGIPGGLPTGVSIVSFDKAAFRHYGLDGAANAAIGYEAADGYARGFQWLRSNRGHSFVVGSTLFLFWTRVKANLDFMMSMNEATAEQVEGVFASVKSGKSGDGIDDANDFYLLAVSGNSARAIVRDYLELGLGKVRGAVRKWFEDLRIADTSKEFAGQPNNRFPLWQLTLATALDSDRVAPDTQKQLMHAALTGGPLPDSVLAACLGRLRADSPDGFRPLRMGLVKLCLIRRNIPVSESLDENERTEAYLYGRLLSLLDQIQNAALGDVNAGVIDKFYRTMSVRPRTIAPRLVGYAQAHLRKMRVDPAKHGKYVWLDRQLTELVNLIPLARGAECLPVGDQGLFVMGFYHQQAKRFTPKTATTEVPSVTTNPE